MFSSGGGPSRWRGIPQFRWRGVGSVRGYIVHISHLFRCGYGVLRAGSWGTIGRMISESSNAVKVLLGLFLSLLLLPAARAELANGAIAAGNVPLAEESAPQQRPIKIFKYRDKNGVRSFSDRAPVGTRYEVIQFSCFACNPRSKLDWYTIPLQLDAFEYTINSEAQRYHVDPALVRAVIHAESAFKPGARSEKGALGLMQLMPDTARDMGVANPLSPEDNIRGGVRYLAWLLEKNSGNTTLATAAYNAGPGAVERYNGIPPYEETQTYVKRVKILHDRYKKALVTAATGHTTGYSPTGADMPL